VNVNKKEYQLGNHNFRVNDKLEPMVSLSALRDLFHVSVSCDPDGKILLQRSSIRANLTLGKRQWTKANGAEAKLTYPPVASGDNVYLPLQDICDMLGGELSWNNKTYTADLDLSTLPPLVLPEHFDLREEQRAAKVRNQGDATTCWAYAASGAMESTFLPANPVQISPDKILGTRGYGFTDSEGGDYMMALSYFLSGKATDQEGHPLSLYEARFHQKEDQREIKESVYRWGGVSTSIYTTGDVTDGGGYNGFTKAYCYRGSEEPNHDVVVIGWDDNFPASNFSGYVPGPGAFICQNSWGEDFGEGGVFYVSYYDTNVGNFGVSYAKLEKTDNYDHIYQSDLLGEVGKVGYNANTNFFANVYTASEEESLKAVGFYTAGQDTSYTVYVVENFKDTGSLATRRELASGTLHDTGFYTIPLHEAVKLEKGEKFAVVVALKTPGSKHPIAIEYDGNPMTKRVDLKDGMGFASGNGIEWDSVENKYKANLCLKAYSDTVTEE
jgi:C1A family cysteine protease